MAQNYIKTVFVFSISQFSVFPLLLILILLEYHVHSQQNAKAPPAIPFFNFVNQMGFPDAYNQAQKAFLLSPHGTGLNNAGPGTYSNFITPFFPKGSRMKRKKGQRKDYNKKGQGQVPETTETVTEVECSKTMYMGPFHGPVQFGLQSTIYKRTDKSCKWSFLGTDPCIPMISCDTTKFTKGCDEEYLEIVDGAQGYLKVCAGNVPVIENFTATGVLRDLFVHFKALKDGGSEPVRNLFTCVVICSDRTKGAGNPLQKGFVPKVNPQCWCGTKPNDDRISGGQTAKKFEFPWLVALVETNTRQPFCGGSIINNRMIITAAHCINGRFMDYQNIQVVVNGYIFDSSPVDAQEPKTYPVDQLEKMDRSNGSSRHNLEGIIIHELYVPQTNDNDIALLRLVNGIDFMAKPPPMYDGTPVQQPMPICLPELESYEKMYSNKMATVAGWGLTSIDAKGSMQLLQKVDVKVFSPQECKEMYQHKVNRRMMCAGYREGGKDSCAGDSGGPLIVEERPRVWTQVGAVSWGEGCGLKDNPGVYVRITEVLQWIHYNSNFDGWRENDEEGGLESRSVWCTNP